MSEKYKARNSEAIYFVTITVVDWLDLITRPIYKHIIIDSLKFCQKNKKLKIYAYVIMTSHIHMIVKAGENSELADIIRDFKTFTSKKLIRAIVEYPESRREFLLMQFSKASTEINRVKKHKVWKDGYHPVELDGNRMIDQKLEYIHKNPVEEEIVECAENYKYSSAINYCGGIGELNIELL